MRNTINNILYHILFALWYAVAKLPAAFHYFNAWWLAMVLHHVVGYRRGVVRKQLTDSFPEKSEADIKRMEREFYRHFCDILVESVMFMGFSEKEIRRRMRFTNIEEPREACQRGRSIALFLGHQANWEWVSSMALWIKDVTKPAQLYHPLENPVMDRIVGYTRERFGSVNISVNESVRKMLKLKKEGTSIMVGFIADQTPMWNNIHHWTPFLNHPETPVFTGAETLAKKLDMDVYYLDVRQVRRGYYEAEFILMTDAPRSLPDYAITDKYTQLLEQTILRQPALWLWSHKRWKRTKAEWEQRGYGKA